MKQITKPLSITFCYYGDDVLKKPCPSAVEFDEQLHRIAEMLSQTLHKKRGLGLAAPQIGISQRICLVSMAESPRDRKQLPEPLFLVNPQVIKSEGSDVSEEGCLSLPDLSAKVERASQITVEYQDLNGGKQTIQASDLVARAIQHEIDHLDGILFIDRLTKMARMRLGKEVRRMRRRIVKLRRIEA